METATQAQVDNRDKNVVWYNDDTSTLTPSTRQFLEKYTGLASDQVIPHIVDIRDRAWKIWPYPCLGEFRFLEPSIVTQPLYPHILERIKAGQKYLDLGCCFAQDIRYLVSQGAPAENIYGSDLHGEFIDLGYELFMDRDKLKSTFITANIFDTSPPSGFESVRGKIDIIYAGSFFHLFDWDDQVKIATRLVSILRPESGSLVLGRQVGSVVPGAIVHNTNESGRMYRHDADSFRRMWAEVGAATGTEWEVDAVLDESENFGQSGKHPLNWHGPTVRRLRFAVSRK
ncbi:hypothetical protein FRB94_008259 [Tulasnella sp. JGI-2019a]|nr:hypothetical protein FRB94_008259 [Tulasnella sp. JGI-2019a]KAG9030883.1 hypothetical protein FRB95_003446 [Tulasnella sp. JGI-2019a]